MNKDGEIINIEKINYFILFSVFFLLIFSINSSLSFTEDYLKHWSTYNKDDIVFIYNSLLYLEGLEQHHLDHPSLFTFIIFPFFYKISYHIGYIDFYNLSSFLEIDDINLSLSKLFYISRLVIQIFSIGMIVLIYKIAKSFSLRSTDALLIGLLFIISTGFISASNRIESGLISIFFLLFSFYLFLKFIKSKNKKSLIYLVFSFLLIFSGMMQKKIMYFAIPFMFLSSIMFLKKNEIIYQKYEIFNYRSLYKYFLIVLYFFVFAFIYYKTIDNNTFHLSRDLDFIFLITNFLGFNLLFFFYIRYFQNKYYENLLTYNILLGVTYFFYKYFLIYTFSAPQAIWSIAFTNFLVQLNMFVGTGDVKGAFDFGSLNLYLLKLTSNFNFIINKYFFSLNYQSILIWTNLLLFLTFFFKISSKERFSILSLFFGFFIVQSIILFRYEQDTYYLNSEFLLLFSLCILLKNIKNKINYMCISIILIISLLNSNIGHLKSLKKSNFESYCYLFKDFESVDGFYDYYTNKIPKNIRKNFCIDYKL